MSAVRTLAIVGLVAGLAAGCSRPAAPSGSGLTNNSSGGEKGADKKPKFDCEFVYSLDLGGAKASGTHRVGRHEGDKLKSTHTVGKDSVTLELAFVEHEGGKDTYNLTYTVREAGNTQTRSSRASYDGKRVVLIEDKHGTAALQPVSKEASEDEPPERSTRVRPVPTNR
jgi:hypothetical protein